MIIHPIKIKSEKEEICVSSEIEWENPNPNFPKTLWFKFPKKYKNYITKNSNAFLVSLLLPAMSLGENIKVKGAISSRLEYNLREYQRVFNFWWPELFKLIEIKCDKYINDKSKNKKGVMSAFSGGVDSFYTLWAHLPENEPNKDYQINHTLFVHGFDIPLEDERTYKIASQSYTKLMNKLKIQLILLSTNLKQFHKDLGWELTYSSAVVGMAFIFDEYVSRFYFPEEYLYDFLPPHGIHFITVPLLSTESFESIDHKGSVSKLDKIKAIANWPDTYDRLRVCWKKPDGLKNCCRCNKCSLRMMVLDMVGALNKYSTFALPIDRKKIRSIRSRKEDLYFPKNMVKFAKLNRRKDIAFDYSYILLFSRIKVLREWIKQKLFR